MDNLSVLEVKGRIYCNFADTEVEELILHMIEFRPLPFVKVRNPGDVGQNPLVYVSKIRVPTGPFFW